MGLAPGTARTGGRVPLVPSEFTVPRVSPFLLQHTEPLGEAVWDAKSNAQESLIIGELSNGPILELSRVLCLCTLHGESEWG